MKIHNLIESETDSFSLDPPPADDEQQKAYDDKYKKDSEETDSKKPDAPKHKKPIRFSRKVTRLLGRPSGPRVIYRKRFPKRLTPSEQLALKQSGRKKRTHFTPISKQVPDVPQYAWAFDAADIVRDIMEEYSYYIDLAKNAQLASNQIEELEDILKKKAIYRITDHYTKYQANPEPGLIEAERVFFDEGFTVPVVRGIYKKY